jgi:hypothetical protein
MLSSRFAAAQAGALCHVQEVVRARHMPLCTGAQLVDIVVQIANRTIVIDVSAFTDAATTRIDDHPSRAQGAQLTSHLCTHSSGKQTESIVL